MSSEAQLRLRETEAFHAVSRAQSALDDAQAAWRLARADLAQVLRARPALETELTYAHERCACGAPMAYWSVAEPEGWDCAAVLVGAADSTIPHTERISFHMGLRLDHSRRAL